MKRLEVPEAVRRKARALGPAGDEWLAELEHVVAALAAEWGIEIGEVLPGGSGALVTTATTADGAAAILKVAIPDGLEGNSPFATELRALELGDGRGYVRVLRADEERRALLLERLGRPLAALGLPVESQIDVLADTMLRAWRPVDAPTTLRTGAQQARFLHGFVAATWRALDEPCARPTIELAEHYARSRGDAVERMTPVLVHGDAHPANVLEDPGLPSTFKLIDPDGMLSEPAHDLAIPLRDWTAELLALGPRVLVDTALEWCARLGDRAGVRPQPIWEWAFVERVSTGLFLLRLGDARGGHLLHVAERLTGKARRFP